MSSDVVFWLAVIAMLVGLAGTVLPALPGIALIWITALIYGIVDRFTTLTPAVFAVITILAAIGLAADFFMTQAATRFTGASWQATIAGVIGGIVGMIVGFFARGDRCGCGWHYRSACGRDRRGVRAPQGPAGRGQGGRGVAGRVPGLARHAVRHRAPDGRTIYLAGRNRTSLG